MATKEKEPAFEEVTAALPPLGGQPERVETRTLAEAKAEEDADFEVMRKHLDKKEKLLLATMDELKSTHIKVCSFRNWLGYEYREVQDQKNALK